MYERMLDKQNRPTAEALAAHCGERAEAFASLNDFLAERYGTAREIRFPYGNRYGWCVTHRKGKKLVCDVFAEAGAFTVMVRLSDERFAAAYPDLLPATRALVDQRYPCGDGGWVHLRVTDDGLLADARRLLEAKLA